jgi:hypothetical protein
MGQLSALLCQVSMYSKRPTGSYKLIKHNVRLTVWNIGFSLKELKGSRFCEWFPENTPLSTSLLCRPVFHRFPGGEKELKIHLAFENRRGKWEHQ